MIVSETHKIKNDRPLGIGKELVEEITASLPHEAALLFVVARAGHCQVPLAIAELSRLNI